MGVIEDLPGASPATLGLVLQAREPGSVAGRCYVCGVETQTGWAEAPSDNFTAWSQIYRGSVMCEACRPIFKDRRFRQRSWVASRDGVEFSSKEDPSLIWRALLAPPEPPFAIYVTAGGQKQGWISLGIYPSTSRSRYWVGTDWTDKPVLMDAAWVSAASPLLERMRGRKVAKAALIDGQFSSGTWERAMREGWEGDLTEALERAGDTRWEVCVRAHP